MGQQFKKGERKAERKEALHRELTTVERLGGHHVNAASALVFLLILKHDLLQVSIFSMQGHNLLFTQLDRIFLQEIFLLHTQDAMPIGTDNEVMAPVV